jgi:N-acetyl-gamma-glutamylphosphate reductase
MAEKVKIGVLGASGYTGSELVRLLLRHPSVDLTLLTADSKAGSLPPLSFPTSSPSPRTGRTFRSISSSARFPMARRTRLSLPSSPPGQARG